MNDQHITDNEEYLNSLTLSESPEVPNKVIQGNFPATSVPKKKKTEDFRIEEKNLEDFTFTLGEISRPDPIADWLWSGIIKSGIVSILAGHPEAGKGIFSTGLALSIVAGRPYLDIPVKQGKVLIVSAEDDRDELSARTYDVANALEIPDSAFKNNIVYFSTIDAGISPALLNSEMQPTRFLLHLRSLVAKHNPRLVILDTLAALAPSGVDITNSTAATQYLANVQAALRVGEHSPTILYTAHLRKPDKLSSARPNIFDLRDSSALVASARSVMLLHDNMFSSDKCNGRRRVEYKYFLDKDDIIDLYWVPSDGFNGALKKNGMLTRQELQQRSIDAALAAEAEKKEKAKEDKKERDMRRQVARKSGWSKPVIEKPPKKGDYNASF